MDHVITDVSQFLTLGMKLSSVIQFAPNDEYSFSCSFIGMKDRQFLIFELSSKVMEDLVTRKTNDARVVVKGVADTDLGHVLAFRSRVIGIKSMGVWLMFVRYPGKVETRQIRKNKRFKVDIKAAVECDNDSFEAEVSDISVSGCGLYVRGRHDLNIAPGEIVKVLPSLEHLPKPYPKCTVVNVRKDLHGTLIGIEFDRHIEVSDELKLEVYELSITRQQAAS